MAGLFFGTMGTMNNAPAFHVLVNIDNARDMIARTFNVVSGSTGETIPYFKVGSASGPVHPMFHDAGEVEIGQGLCLGYDYDNDNYDRNGWFCVVTRINRKSITVESRETGTKHIVRIDL